MQRRKDEFGLVGTIEKLAWQERIVELSIRIDQLLSGSALSFENATPSKFPEKPGIYVIFDRNGSCLRAGKTSATLRQRLYHNHLMGRQPGNLPAQLIGSRVCSNHLEAKEWIRKNCVVHWLEIEHEDDRNRSEHFMLSVLCPRYCDSNRWG